MTPLGKKSGSLKYLHKKISRPCPPRVVDNPKRILRRGNTRADKGISHLQRASSFPTKSVNGFTSFDFDKELIYPFTDLSLKAKLCQALTGPERPNIF